MNSATGRVGMLSTATAAQITAGTPVNNTWNGPIVIQGNPVFAQLFSIATGTFTVNGNITADPSYSGTITIRGGTATSFGVLNGTVNAPASSLLKTEASNWTISSTGNNWGANSANNGTWLANGTVNLGISDALPTTALLTMGENASLTLATVFDMKGFNQTVAGLVGNITNTATTTTATQNVTNTGVTLSTLTIDNAVARSYANTGVSTTLTRNLITGNIRLIKIGVGTQTLAGRNTYTGGTVVNDGELNLTGLGTYGAGTFTVNGGILRFSAAQATTAGVQVTGGNFVIASPNTFSGGVQVSNNGTFTLSATGAFSGGVSVNGANALFTTTAANSVYTGGTTLTDGTIRIGTSSTSLGSLANNVTTINGGVFDLNGFNQTIGAWAGTGGSITNTSTTANSVLTVGSSVTSGTYSGTVTDTFGVSGNTFGQLGITKTSTGTITLAGTHTYTGNTTGNGGTLRFNTALPSNSPITINNNGTLSVATSFANYANVLSVSRGGTFNLSSGTPTTASNLTGLTVGTGTATANPALNFQIGATSDLLALSLTSIITLPIEATNLTTINITALAGFGVGTYTLISDADPTGRLMPFVTTSSFVFGATTGAVGSFGYGLLSSPTAIQLVVTAIIPSSGPIYWTGSQSASWNTLVNASAGNFTTDLNGSQPMIGSPNSNTIVNFSSSTATATNIATTLDGSYTILGLVFNNQTASGTITTVSIGIGSVSTSTLTLTPSSSAGGIDVQTSAPSTININVPIVLGANQTFTVADAATTLSINGTGNISGAFNLTKAGPGTAVIRIVGTTYTGNTTISGGTLNLAPTATSTHSGIISGAGNLVKSGTSTLNLGNANTYTGTTTITGGTTILSSLANGGLPSSIGASSNSATNFVVEGTTTATIQVTGLTNTTDRNITLNNTTSTTLVLPTDGSSLTLNGSLSGTVPTVIFGTAASTGGQTSTFNLFGDNTGFAANITLNNSAVVIKAASGLGSGTKTISNSTSTSALTSLQLDGSAGQIRLETDFTFNTSFGGAVNNLPTKAIINLAGNNTIASNFTMTGDNTFQSNGGTLTVSGAFTHATASTTRSVILDGTSMGNNLFTGTLTDATTSLVGLVKGPGSGTWIVNSLGSLANTGTTKILGGILRSGKNDALSTIAPLQFGDTATALATATGTFDMANFDQTVSALSVVSNSATPNSLIINVGKTLTVTGNVNMGVAPSDTAETALTATGGGSLVVNNPVASGIFALGATATAGVGSRVIADFSGLGSLTINLDPTTGIIRVNPNGTSNLANRISTLILPSTGLGTTTMTANVLSVGDGLQSNGAGMVNLLRLGSGINTINVNTVNVGTGTRDQGRIDFNTATGSLIVRDATGLGRAAFNISSGTSSTGLPADDLVDLRGHNADLLLTNLVIGNRPRSGTQNSTMFFDQGTLDANAAVIGFRTQTVESGTGVNIPRVMNAALNVGGGTASFQNGVSSIGSITGTGYTVVSRPHTVTGSFNVTGGTVTVGAVGGISTTLATLDVTGVTNAAALTVTGAINISGGNVTFQGDIARGVVSGTSTGAITSTATLSLTGGTLNMTGKNIDAIDSLTFNGGTLRNVGTLNRALMQTNSSTASVLDVAANSTTITGNYTLSGGTASIADARTLTVGSAVISGGTTLAIGFSSTPNSSGQLTSANTIDLTSLTPANKLNIPLTVSPDLTGTQAFTLTVISSSGAGITYSNGNTFDPTAFAPSATNFIVGGPFIITGNANVVQISFTASPVPEPTSILGIAFAGLGLARAVRRRSRYY